MKKAVIDIKGMDCASDAVDIERSLLKIRGVRNVTVNYLIHKGFIYVDEDVNDEDLKSAIKRAGYDVASIRFKEKK